MRNLNPGLPLVLFIDDLHWADRALLDWLDYVTHRFNASNNMQGLLLVCAYRPDDAPTALIHRTAGWIREGLAQRVALERLTIEESAALMQSLGGDASLSKQLQDQSSGNPLFLIELCRAAPGIIPPTLSELITVRLDRLGDAARQVLQASAVLEADFGFATLAKVSGRSEDEMLDALDELLNADVLSERAGRYAFVHPVVAAVVEQSFSGARRAVLHRRAAAAREAEYATRLPQIAGRLAMHYTHADDPAKAAFFRKALQLQPNPERRMKLGRVVYMQGELAEARRIFTEALYAFKASGDRLNIARAYLSIADSYLPSGAFDQVTHWVYEACAVLDTTANPEEYARAEFLLGASRLSESLSDAERHLRTATRIAAENNIADMAAQSRFELGNLYAERGELDSARAAYREAIALSREAGSPVQEALAHNNAAYHALLAGDLEEAHHEVQAGLALAEQSALRLPLQYLYSTRGEMALAEGKWRDAQDWFNKGMAEAEYAGNTRQVVNYVANLGLAARGSGDLDSALISLQSARDMAKTLNVPHLRTQIDLWLAELHIQRHEHAAALESLAQAEARLTDTQRRGLREWTERLRAQL
jgi:tetratricopeptide (TPR) repeat protein